MDPREAFTRMVEDRYVSVSTVRMDPSELMGILMTAFFDGAVAALETPEWVAAIQAALYADGAASGFDGARLDREEALEVAKRFPIEMPL